MDGAWRRDAGISRIPASPRERSDARGRGATGEELADQKLQRSEVAVGQVLEAPAARSDGVVGSGEAPDDLRQVLGVLAELQLDGPTECWVTVLRSHPRARAVACMSNPCWRSEARTAASPPGSSRPASRGARRRSSAVISAPSASARAWRRQF